MIVRLFSRTSSSLTKPLTSLTTRVNTPLYPIGDITNHSLWNNIKKQPSTAVNGLRPIQPLPTKIVDNKPHTVP